jgi:elastase-2
LFYNLINILKIESNKSLKDENNNNKSYDEVEEDYLYSNQTCGQTTIQPNFNPLSLRRARSKRIIGGEEAIPNSWPWVVSVRLKVNNSQHSCGGSLIHDELVLTAAHCMTLIIKASIIYNISVENIFSMIEVHIGINDHRSHDIDEEFVYDIKYFDFHKDFKGIDHSLLNDIAIIRLKRKVRLDRPEVGLVCLPRLASFSGCIHTGDDLVTIGWGTYAEEFNHGDFTLDNLQQIILTAVDPMSSECNSGQIGDKWDKANIICAHSKEKNKSVGTCFGDSGGPVTVYRNNRWIIVGIISFGHFVRDEKTKKYKCDASKPSYFVKVSSYLDWIQAHIDSIELKNSRNKTENRN